jgi:hypothetical protein
VKKRQALNFFDSRSRTGITDVTCGFATKVNQDRYRRVKLPPCLAAMYWRCFGQVEVLVAANRTRGDAGLRRPMVVLGDWRKSALTHIARKGSDRLHVTPTPFHDDQIIEALISVWRSQLGLPLKSAAHAAA